MRSALLLTLWAFLISVAGGALLPLANVSAVVRLLLQTMLTLIGFGGAAYGGLYLMDGRHTELIPCRVLSVGQVLWLCAAGVLAVAPASLASDLTQAVMKQGEAAGSAFAHKLFIPLLVRSALIVPLCEELFFRGYLMRALSLYGRRCAFFATALLFALMHAGAFVPQLLMGLLLGFAVVKTDSLAAPLIVHGCYNLTIVLLSALGLDALFCGLTIAGCALRLLLCAALIWALARLCRARVVRLKIDLLSGGRLTKKETALLAAAAIALLACVVLAGVTA